MVPFFSAVEIRYKAEVVCTIWSCEVSRPSSNRAMDAGEFIQWKCSYLEFWVSGRIVTNVVMGSNQFERSANVDGIQDINSSVQFRLKNVRPLVKKSAP